MRIPQLASAAVVSLSVLALAACASTSATSGATETINIVGFAVPEAANKNIQAEFAKTEAGKGVQFSTSYGASGDQSRAVVDGLKADYVHLSVASDVDRLVGAELVDEAWDDGPNKGIVSTSVVVLGVREGNPKNIQGWDDLAQPGIGIVTANPASSGAARWNALAAWGHVSENGGSEEEATAFIDAVFANVVSLTNSGRDATQAFLGGAGDVLLAYENEAIAAQEAGEDIEYVVPDSTLLIETPIAVTEGADAAAQSFVDYLYTDEAQQAWADYGYRPVVKSVLERNRD
ncbi:MAG: sulfate ABC transporter substrate-binding protein, partial [Actinomycetota bacterium]|nr:sulfate ABC transporter substrate-binding protein [Actinomycetota bacterium]